MMRPCLALLVVSLLGGCQKPGTPNRGSAPDGSNGCTGAAPPVDSAGRAGASATAPAAPPGRASGKIEESDVEVVQAEGVVRPDGMIELQLLAAPSSPRQPCTEVTLPSLLPGDAAKTPTTMLALRLPWRTGVADPSQTALHANYPRRTGETWSRSSARWSPTGAIEVLAAPTEVGSAGRLKMDVKLAPDEAKHLRGGSLRGEIPVYVCAQPMSLKMR